MFVSLHFCMFLLLLLFCCLITHLILLTGHSSARIITPVQTEMSGAEGENITLFCNYTSANTVQWNRQSHRSTPEFLFVHATGAVLQKSKMVDSDPRFSAKVNEDTQNTTTLNKNKTYSLCSDI